MSKEKVLQIIATAPVGFVATIDGTTPKVRPMAIQVVWDNKLYASTFRNSRKMEQIGKNPRTEIAWVDKDMRQVRISGTISVCQDKSLKKKFFDKNPTLKNYFKGVDDPNYTLLEIKPERVEWMDINSKKYEEIAW